jgi:hypothetical protein
MLEESDPFSGWTSHDYRLQEAVYILNKERCQSCGNPVWLCHSTNNAIDFKVKTGVCYAKAEIEDFEDNPSNEKLGSGEYHYAEPIGIENEDGTFDPLPSRREALASTV